MLWQSAAPSGRSPWRLGVLCHAQTCRFDEAHIKLGNPLTGGQNCIRHSSTAETGIILDRLNRRDKRLSRGPRGREPMRAQMRVSVPFWPIRASSWNQISSGLPRAVAGRAWLTMSAKFF